MKRFYDWIKSWSHQQWVLLIGMIIAFDTLLTACGPKKIDDVRTETRYDIIVYECDGTIWKTFENVDRIWFYDNGSVHFEYGNTKHVLKDWPMEIVKKEVAVRD